MPPKGGKAKKGEDSDTPPSSAALALKEIQGYTNEDGTEVEPVRFNLVAQKYSEDKAKDGGLLGWKRREELNGVFAEAAFKLAKGQMTQTPVKTSYGYHLIVCEDRKA